MSGCWTCGSDDIAYTDPIGCEWCLEHYEEFYLDGDEGKN